MLKIGWIVITVVAMGATAIALSTKSEGAALWPNDDGVAIFAGVVGFVSWGFWTYGTLNIEIVTETGTVVSQSMPAVTYFGLMMMLIPGYIALTGPVDIIRRSRNATLDDL